MTDMKHFAMTLHYYSPKAYDFVRNVLSLPHLSSVRTWVSTVDCHGEAAKKQPLMTDVVLVVNAMTLHKGTTWDPKSRQYVGNTDYTTGVPEASDDLAMEALVFLAVGLTGYWKHPIAYVLQD